MKWKFFTPFPRDFSFDAIPCCWFCKLIGSPSLINVFGINQFWKAQISSRSLSSTWQTSGTSSTGNKQPRWQKLHEWQSLSGKQMAKSTSERRGCIPTCIWFFICWCSIYVYSAIGALQYLQCNCWHVQPCWSMDNGGLYTFGQYDIIWYNNLKSTCRS